MNKFLAVRGFDFQGNPVRCLGTEKDLWFVAKDICEALGIVWKGDESLASIPSHWKGVRKFRTPTPQNNGSIRDAEVEMIVIRESAVYKLVFRSNKPAADAFTNWIAEEVLPSIARTGMYVAGKAQKYAAMGKDPEWIEQRQDGVEARKDFTGTLQAHGVKGAGYADCTNQIYKPLLGGTATLVKVRKGLAPKANLRDNLTANELLRVAFAESLAKEKIERDELNGTLPCANACRESSSAVAAAITTVLGS
jgi:prophage antirepressor-like protein